MDLNEATLVAIFKVTMGRKDFARADDPERNATRLCCPPPLSSFEFRLLLLQCFVTSPSGCLPEA